MNYAYFGLAAALLASATTANAATIIFSTTGTTSTAATQTVLSDGVTATFSGGTYTGSVAAMNAAGGNVGLTARDIQRSSTGLGVAQDGEANQIDSNGAKELLEVVFSLPQRYRIVSARVGKVDNTDTFALFGGNGGTYTRLGFTGAIQTGISGGIPVTRTKISGTGGDQVYQLDFNYGVGFDSFRFGTNDESADGYSLVSLSVAAVPEPATWAMMIMGFGLVGGTLRSKKRVRVALIAA